MKNLYKLIGNLTQARSAKVPLGITAVIAVIVTVLASCASFTVVGIDTESVTGPNQVRQYRDIDPKDITVYAFFKDGSRKPLTINKAFINFDSSKAGRQTVTVKTTGNFESVSFETEVMALTGIRVASQPRALKIGYNYSAELWPGLEIEGIWDGMGSEKIGGYTTTGYNREQVGRQTVTVAWNGKQTTFTAEVVDVQSIRIASNPTKLTYNYGENLDLAGMKVISVWPILGEEEINIAPSSITGYNRQTVGRQTVTVTYRGKTATFTVEVKESPYDPALNGNWVMVTQQTKVEYELRFNNGTYEQFTNGTPSFRFTYTTSGGKITQTLTHYYVAPDSKFGIPTDRWYSKTEVENSTFSPSLLPEGADPAGYKQALLSFFSTSTMTYSISGNRLTLTQEREGATAQIYTKR